MVLSLPAFAQVPPGPGSMQIMPSHVDDDGEGAFGSFSLHVTASVLGHMRDAPGAQLGDDVIRDWHGAGVFGAGAQAIIADVGPFAFDVEGSAVSTLASGYSLNPRFEGRGHITIGSRQKCAKGGAQVGENLYEFKGYQRCLVGGMLGGGTMAIPGDRFTYIDFGGGIVKENMLARFMIPMTLTREGVGIGLVVSVRELPVRRTSFGLTFDLGFISQPIKEDMIGTDLSTAAVWLQLGGVWGRPFLR